MELSDISVSKTTFFVQNVSPVLHHRPTYKDKFSTHDLNLLMVCLVTPQKLLRFEKFATSYYAQMILIVNIEILARRLVDSRYNMECQPQNQEARAVELKLSWTRYNSYDSSCDVKKDGTCARTQQPEKELASARDEK